MNYIDKKTYFFFLLIIIIPSIYIKFFNITNIFSEFDDIGVITLFKGFMGEKIININFLFFEKEILIDQNFFSNFENSILLPLYIFWDWTYSPLQYIFYRFFDISNQSLNLKLFFIRFPSAIFSLMSLVCFLIIMNKINLNKISKLLSICLLAYSFNSNIYANHASPYSAYIFAGFFGILNLFYYSKKNHNKKFILINTLTLYLSYTNIIFYLFFLFIKFKNNNLVKFFRELFIKFKLFTFLNIIIILPIIIKFLFSSHTVDTLYRSDKPQQNLIWINEFILNIYLGLKFILTGLIGDYFFILFIFFLILLFAIILKNKKLKFSLFSKCSFIFIISWLILFFFKLVPFGETRHSLIILPFVLIIISEIFDKSIPENKIILIPILLLVIQSSLANIKILQSKNSLFNFELLQESNLDIYSYGFTLEPFLLTKIDNKIYNTDLSSFLNNDKILNSINDEFYLVSTLETLDEKLKTDNKFFNFLKKEYNFDVIKEITTKHTHSYANNCCYKTDYISWGQNNFYLYKAKKK